MQLAYHFIYISKEELKCDPNANHADVILSSEAKMKRFLSWLQLAYHFIYISNEELKCYPNANHADVILSSEAKQKKFYPACNLHIILFTFQMKSWSAIQMLIMLM